MVTNKSSKLGLFDKNQWNTFIFVKLYRHFNKILNVINFESNKTANTL